MDQFVFSISVTLFLVLGFFLGICSQLWREIQLRSEMKTVLEKLRKQSETSLYLLDKLEGRNGVRFPSE